MANLRQNAQGRWDITSLYHNFSEDVKIPVTLKYNNENPIEYTISNARDVGIATPWYTPLNREKIQTNTETALEEGTGITFTSQTVSANAGLCKISSIDWEITPYVPPVVERYEIEVRPTRQTGSINEGCVTFSAYWVKYVNDVKKSEENITNTASWSVNSVASATVNRGEVCFNNTDTANTKTITVTATNEGKSATGEVVVPKKGHTPVIEYDVITTGASRVTSCTGTTKLTAYLVKYADGEEVERTDITKSTDTEWSVTSGSQYASVNNTGNNKGTVTYDNTGSSNVTVEIRAIYSGDTSYNGRFRITIPACEAPEPVVTYALEVSGPSTTAMTECTGSVSLTAEYITYLDGEESERDDVTTSATWSITAGSSVASVNRGVVSFENTGTGPVTVTAKATYGGKSDTFRINVPNCEEPHVTTYEVLITGDSTTMDSCQGTIDLTAYYITKVDGEETNRTDVTASADWSSSNNNIATVNKGKVTYNNTGSSEITVTISAESQDVSNTYDITIPVCEAPEPTVDHCEITTNPTSLSFTGAGTKSISVTGKTYYSDGTTANTEVNMEWIPETCDGLIIEETSPYFIKNAVSTGRTGSGPYTYSFTLPATATGASHGGTVKFSSADCTGTSKSVCMSYNKPIVYPTISVSSNLDSSYGGMYGFHVMFSNLDASTKNITWKVNINNPIFTVRYTPDPNSGERTDMDSWPSIEFTGYTDETGLIGGYELVNDNIKSSLFPSQSISIGRESGPEEVFLWVRVPPETTLNFATLSNEREINNNVGGKSIGPIK